MPARIPTPAKRRYRTATVTGNRADAKRALARLVAEVQSDKTIGSTSTTLNFYAQAVPGGDAQAAATLEALLASSGRTPATAVAEADEPTREQTPIFASVTDDAR